MSIGKITVHVHCDRCTNTITVEVPNLEHALADTDRALVEESWSQISAIGDVCPNHPQSIAAPAAFTPGNSG